MSKDANGKGAKSEANGSAVHRDLEKLAAQIEMLSPKRLEILAGMLSRADQEEHAQLLEEMEIRQKLRAHMGRVDAGFWVLAAVAILVATVMRVNFLAVRPFVGFGLLGAVLLLAGLRRWYRASEVRERVTMIDAKASVGRSADLVESWIDGAEDLQEPPLPQLRNTDGEEFAFIADHYRLVGKAARAAIEAELAKMPDVEAPEPGEREQRYMVMRDHGGDAAMPSTLIASIVVKAREIVVETNSRDRADRLRERSAALGATDAAAVLADGRGEQNKTAPVASGDRQILDQLLIDHLRDLGLFQVEQSGVGRYLDRGGG